MPNPYRFLYQDESGDVGKSDCPFVVGILFVRERQPIWDAIRRARKKHEFHNEFHFSRISKARERAYIEVLREVAKLLGDAFTFQAIVVRKQLVNLKYFSNNRHMAYNFFTKLLLLHKCRNVHEAILYSDEKVRIKEDNFLSYLETELNLTHERCILTKVESIDSKEDDLIQLTDLLTGAVGNVFAKPPSDRKRRVMKEAFKLGLLHGSRIWNWEPKKK